MPAAKPAPPIIDARLSLGAAVLDDLFPEGDAFRRSLRTFAVLLALSGFIATFGLYQDSVAAIIGAMVVAPLGGAILAVGGALVTARLRWQAITIVQVAAGATGVVAIAFGVSLLIPDPLTINPAIHSRTEPGLLDLGVALAAGAAGAYVAVRQTGADALPGVAIAVSLVPPLAVVGICLELGRLDDAAGALLLFATNFAAIVVAAAVVFVLAGAAPSREMAAERRRLRTGIAAAAIALLVISIPLAWRAAESVSVTIDANRGAPVVRDWLAGLDLEVTGWRIDGRQIELTLLGPDEVPDPADLARGLAAALGRPVELTIDHVPVIRERATAGD